MMQESLILVNAFSIIKRFSSSREAKGSSNKIKVGLSYNSLAKHILLASPRL